MANGCAAKFLGRGIKTGQTIFLGGNCILAIKRIRNWI